ncbi:MAG TPA: Maf family protein, partial [Phycisphaerales bacterium]|nr:Maf family protein [Phycisphaerales bacterium]
MNPHPHIWLASSSPRRKQLLERAGYECSVCPPTVNDGVLNPGNVSPTEWVMALAYLKAANVARNESTLMHAGNSLFLGADTVC